MAQSVNSTRKAANKAADAVGKIGKVTVEDAANDAVMAVDNAVEHQVQHSSHLPSSTPSKLEQADSSHIAMAGWMATPIAGGLAALGRASGRLGDKLGWAGAPLRGLRTALGMPSDILKSPVSHVGSEIAHGKIWSSHLAPAEQTHKQGVKALKKAEGALGDGWISRLRGSKGAKADEFKALAEKVEEIKNRFGGVMHENFAASEPRRLEPAEFMKNAGAFDAAAARREFDAVARQVETKLKAADNQAALKQLENARKQFGAFLTKAADLKAQVKTAEPAVKSAIASATALAERETAAVAANNGVVSIASRRLEKAGTQLETAAPVNWVRGKVVEFNRKSAQANHAKGMEASEQAGEHLKSLLTVAQGDHLGELNKALDVTSKEAKKAAAAARKKLADEARAARAMPEGPAKVEALRAFRKNEIEKLHEDPVRAATASIRKKLATEKEAIKAMPAGAGKTAALEAFAKKEETVTAALKKAESHVSNYSKAALKAHDKFSTAARRTTAAEGMRDLGKKLGSLPGAIAKMPAHDLLYHGLYGMSQAANVYRVGTSFTTPMHTLEHMYEGVTGKKASARTILAGDLPESMQQASSHYWRAAVPAALTNIVSAGVTHKYMRPGAGGGGWKALPAMMLIQGGAAAIGMLFTPKNDLIATYQKVAEAQQKGEDVPKAAIAALLVAAKPELGKLDVNDASLLTVAQKYTEQHKSAAEVLKTIDTGEFAKDLAAAQAQAKAQAATDTLAPAAAAPEAAKTSEAPAAAESANAAKPVVGSFSAKLATENRGAKIAVAPAGPKIPPAPAPSHAEAALQKGDAAGAVR